MNKPKDKIIIVGSANTDMVIRAPHFPQPGETIIGSDFMLNQGGKGANQAVAAARLGGHVAFIGKVGDDTFGTTTRKLLKDEGIDVSHLSTSSSASSGVALITTVPNGENTIIVNSGANAELSASDVEAAKELFTDAAIVLMQLETPVSALTRAAELGKENGARVILNPAPAPSIPLPEALLRNVDLIIPNETEAAHMTGITVTDEASARAAIGKLQSLGVADAMITLGSKGVCALVHGELTIVPAFKVQAVDTTAAGDTFCGALCVALCHGCETTRALRFANKASSLSVQRRGAQMSMPRLRDVVSDSTKWQKNVQETLNP